MGRGLLSAVVGMARFCVCSRLRERVRRDRWVLVHGVSDLILILVGSDEFEPLTLSSTMGTVIDTLQEATGRKLSETTVVSGYGKICVSLDEAIGPGGNLEWTDIDVIARQSKLKPPAAIKK